MQVITQEEFDAALKKHQYWSTWKQEQIKHNRRRDIIDNEQMRRNRMRFQDCDLRECKINSMTDLSEAYFDNVCWDGMRLLGMDFHCAIFVKCSFIDADLERCDFSRACCLNSDFTNARLVGVNFHGCELANANFISADIDYASLPMSCNSLHLTVDQRIAVQMAYHFCALNCDDPAFITARNAILDFANTFHRVEECGKLIVKE